MNAKTLFILFCPLVSILLCFKVPIMFLITSLLPSLHVVVFFVDTIVLYEIALQVIVICVFVVPIMVFVLFCHS
jgi:hypothetical protein